MKFPNNFLKLHDPQNHAKAIFYTDLLTIDNINTEGLQLYLMAVRDLVACIECRTLDHFSRFRYVTKVTYFFMLQRYFVLSNYKNESKVDARKIAGKDWHRHFTITTETLTAICQLFFYIALSLQLAVMNNRTTVCFLA